MNIYKEHILVEHIYRISKSSKKYNFVQPPVHMLKNESSSKHGECSTDEKDGSS